MINKHHNHEYDGGLPNIPLDLGDRYYGQDLGRDYHYLIDRLGNVARDHFVDAPFIVSGGVALKGAGDSLNITAFVGYVKFDVNVPDIFGASPPPPVITERISSIRVNFSAQVNLAIPSATLNGSSVNFIKVKYKELDGDTRDRARKVGSYAYDQSPSFEIVVDTVAPLANGTEILIGAFTGVPSGPYVFTNDNRDEIVSQIPVLPAKDLILDTTPQTFPVVAHYKRLHITDDVTIKARVIIIEEDLTIDSGKTLTFDNYLNLIVSPVSELNNPLRFINAPGRGAIGSLFAGGGYGGRTTSTVGGNNAGGGGYNTTGGNGDLGTSELGGAPLFFPSIYNMGTGLGGNGGDGVGNNSGGGGGGVGGGGGTDTANGGDGGPAVLIIVKGDLINNGTISCNGKDGSAVGNGSGGGGGGFLAIVAYGKNNVMGAMEAAGGDGLGDRGGGGGGGHIATLRNSGSAPIPNVANGNRTGNSGFGIVGTSIALDMATNKDLSFGGWGSTDIGIITNNFIYDVLLWGILL